MADITQESEAPLTYPLTLPNDGKSNSPSPASTIVNTRREVLTSTLGRPELGHLARWHVSSHKYGFGIDSLQDNDENTFWQYVPPGHCV